MVFRGVIGIIVSAVVAEAVSEMILAEVGELRSTSSARVVARIDAADQIAPMVGGAAGAGRAANLLKTPFAGNFRTFAR